MDTPEITPFVNIAARVGGTLRSYTQEYIFLCRTLGPLPKWRQLVPGVTGPGRRLHIHHSYIWVYPWRKGTQIAVSAKGMSFEVPISIEPEEAIEAWTEFLAKMLENHYGKV